VLSYPFVSHQDNEIFGHQPDDVILANPLDSLVNRMRVSLIPGLLDSAHRNYSRGFTSLALFEGGLVFLPKNSKEGTTNIPVGNAKPSLEVIDQLYRSVPNQPWHVAGLFLGDITQRSPGQPAVPSDVASALDAARVVGAALGVEFHVLQATHPAYHPGRYATLQVHGETIGFVGEVLPVVAHGRDLPTRVSVFSIDADRVLELSPDTPHTATPISGYPAATQDVSLVVQIDIPAGSIRDQVAQGAGELLEAIHLVDDYRGEGIEPGYRSLTFALRFRAPDRTLTQAEATATKDLGVAQAHSVYGAVIRA
jgi:phenylalanyl-tRNA synthetase beta chain